MATTVQRMVANSSAPTTHPWLRTNQQTRYLEVYDCSSALLLLLSWERVQIKIEFNLERFSSFPRFSLFLLLCDFLAVFFCRRTALLSCASWLLRSFDPCLIEVVRDFKGTRRERKRQKKYIISIYWFHHQDCGHMHGCAVWLLVLFLVFSSPPACLSLLVLWALQRLERRTQTKQGGNLFRWCMLEMSSF